jgi:hypothetical protein
MPMENGKLPSLVQASLEPVLRPNSKYLEDNKLARLYLLLLLSSSLTTF